MDVFLLAVSLPQQWPAHCCFFPNTLYGIFRIAFRREATLTTRGIDNPRNNCSTFLITMSLGPAAEISPSLNQMPVTLYLLRTAPDPCN